jgi:hypothetical protein
VTLAFRQSQSGTVLLAAPTGLIRQAFSIATTAQTALYLVGTLSSTQTRIASSVKAASVTEAASNTRVASSLKAVTETMQATRTAVASSLRAGTGADAATKTVVASEVRASSATAQATRIAVASSLRAASGVLADTTTLVISEVRASTGAVQASQVDVTSSVKPVSVTIQASRTAVASSLRAATVTMAAQVARVASEVRANAVQIQSVQTRLASSLKGGQGTLTASSARVASEVRANAVQVQATRTAVASSLRAGTAALQAAQVVVASSLTALSAGEAAHATLLASSLRASTGQTQATQTQIRSSLKAVSATAQAMRTAVSSSLRAATGSLVATMVRVANEQAVGNAQVQSTRSALTSSLRAGSGTLHAVAANVPNAPTHYFVQIQATRTAVTSSLKAVSGTAQATTARVASEVRANAAQVATTAVRLASSLKAGTGQIQAAHTHIGSSLKAGTGQTQAIQTQIRSSLKPVTVQAQASQTQIRSSLKTVSSGVAALSQRLASGVKTGAGQAQAAQTQIRSSLKAGLGHYGGLAISAPGTFLASAQGQMSGRAGLATYGGTVPGVIIRVPATTHQAGAVALVDVYDAATLTHMQAGTIRIDPISADVTVQNRTGQATTVLVQQTQPSYSQAFSNQTSVTILGAIHQLGSALLVWQVVDTTGVVLEPTMTVDSTTFDVTFTFRQAQSGTMVLGRGLLLYSQAFSATTQLVVPGATHGFQTLGLRVQCYDNGSPVRTAIQPGHVQLNQSTFDVTTTFRQAQAGVLLISAQPGVRVTGAAPSAAVSTAGQGTLSGHAQLVATQPGTGVTTTLIPGTTHPFAANPVLVYAYDTSGFAAEIGDVAFDPATHDIALTFDQALQGALVMRQTPLPYLQIVSNVTTVTITGATHGLGTANLFWQLVTNQTPGHVAPPATVVLNAITFDVTFTFLQPFSGTIVLTQGLPVFAQSFSQQTTVTIPATTHGLGANLVWQLYDTSTPTFPTSVQPNTFRVTPGTNDVTATFDQPQTGLLLLSAATPLFLAGVQSASLTLQARVQGLGAPRVVTNVRALSSQLLATAARVASSARAYSAFVTGHSALVGSSLRAVTVREQALGLPSGSALTQRSVTVAASPLFTASSLRVGHGTMQTLSMPVASELRATAVHVASLLAKTASSVRASTATMQATRTAIASEVEAVSAHVQASATGRLSQVLTRPAVMQEVATRQVLTNLRAGAATFHTQAQVGGTLPGNQLTTGQSLLQGLAREVTSEVRALAVTFQGRALTQFSSVHVGTSVTAAQTTRVASSAHAGNGQLQGLALSRGNAVAHPVGGIQAQALVRVSSAPARPAVGHLFAPVMLSSTNFLLELATAHAQGILLAASQRHPLVLARAFPQFLTTSLGAGRGQSVAQALLVPDQIHQHRVFVQSQARLTPGCVGVARLATQRLLYNATALNTVSQVQSRAAVARLDHSLHGALAHVRCFMRVRGRVRYGPLIFILGPGNTILQILRT